MSNSKEEIGLPPFGLRLLKGAGLAVLIALAGASPSSFAAGEQGVPAWLEAHVGEGEGQIAPVVLERARALYQRKGVRNPCYFAMDATRPHDLGGGLGRRFYVICEAQGSFRAISAGHGGGRDLDGTADFSNGRRCVKNFGNAMDSDLTTGGAYVTADIAAAFKGYYRAPGGGEAELTRPFLKFDGEGETANARERAIGGHPAVLIRGVCRQKNPTSPRADQDGYVPFGKIVNYEAGRSDGCTSWSPSDAETVIAMVKDDPTTLYIYPESRDIDAVARAVEAGEAPSRAGLYWNAACLRDIGAPRFWRKETLEPILARYREAHPAPPPQPPPICRE